MRIGMVLLAFPELSETFVLNQIVGLMRHGHQVRVYAFARRDGGCLHGDIRRYDLLRQTRYIGHGEIKKKRYRAWAVAGDGVRVLLRAPSRAPTVLALRRRSPRLWGFQFLPLARALAAGPPLDVLHCQFGTLGIAGAMCKQAGLLPGKLLVSFRGADITRGVAVHGEEAYRYVCAQADRLLPVCGAFGERLAGLGCPRHKIEVLHSGIDLQRFPLRERHLPAGGEVRILSVGRLTGKKGLDIGIRAFARIHRAYPRSRYILVGDGPDRHALQALAADLGVDRAVEFAGPKTREQVAAYLAEAHLFLAPSRTTPRGEKEGIPNTLKEAMASGIPVVSTYHSGIPELVQDGVSGLLVAEGDDEALAQAVLRLLQGLGQWAAMGKEGRKRIEEEYDIERLNRRLEALYARPAGR